jgi:hypothetical protein
MSTIAPRFGREKGPLLAADRRRPVTGLLAVGGSGTTRPARFGSLPRFDAIVSHQVPSGKSNRERVAAQRRFYPFRRPLRMDVQGGSLLLPELPTRPTIPPEATDSTSGPGHSPWSQMSKQHVDAAAIQQDVIAGHLYPILLRRLHVRKAVLRLHDHSRTWRIHTIRVDRISSGIGRQQALGAEPKMASLDKINAVTLASVRSEALLREGH